MEKLHNKSTIRPRKINAPPAPDTAEKTKTTIYLEEATKTEKPQSREKDMDINDHAMLQIS